MTTELNAIVRKSQTYRVRHITRYSYDAIVDHSFGRTYLSPRNTPNQHVLEHDLHFSPEASDRHQHEDIYGNLSTFVQIEAHHTMLEVIATTRVKVSDAIYTHAALELTWETCRDATSSADWLGNLPPEEFTLPSPRVQFSDRVFEFAAEIFTPGKAIRVALSHLMAEIHDRFSYSQISTDVNSSVEQLFEAGGGVCQDFAHLAVASARAQGLAARYVSGYLRTYSPAGQNRLVGADASHAWASILVPGAGWIDIDPTNNKFTNHEFITTAWGRDYDDIPPLKGVVFSSASANSTLAVEVDVIPED